MWLQKLSWFGENWWSASLCPLLTHASPIHYSPGELNEFCLPELFLKILDLLKLFIFPRNDSSQAPGNKWCLGTISLFLFQATGIPQISTSVPKPWRVSITSRQLWVFLTQKKDGIYCEPWETGVLCSSCTLMVCSVSCAPLAGIFVSKRLSVSKCHFHEMGFCVWNQINVD